MRKKLQIFLIVFILLILNIFPSYANPVEKAWLDIRVYISSNYSNELKINISSSELSSTYILNNDNNYHIKIELPVSEYNVDIVSIIDLDKYSIEYKDNISLLDGDSELMIFLNSNKEIIEDIDQEEVINDEVIVESIDKEEKKDYGTLMLYIIGFICLTIIISFIFKKTID